VPGALIGRTMSAEIALYVFIAIVLALDALVIWLLRG
jgi:hypothetical protein